MGLKANGISNGFGGRLFGAAQGAFARPPLNLFNNRAMFDSKTSVPQGYTNPLDALLMTFAVSGNISARFIPETEMTATMSAQGNMSAALEGEFDVIANGNLATNGYATFTGEFDMTGESSAIGSMSANMDLIARPSANDIAQEVWNAQASAFQTTGTLGKSLSSAESAAKLGAALSA